jgi:nucleoside 2-deoxyribosyltransferase
MRVYVASAYEDFARARAVMAALRERGIDISHDWTTNVDAYPTDDAPAELKAQHAREDLDGVLTADAVLVLTNDDKAKGCGMWIELGAALALGKYAVITGGQRRRSIFAELTRVHVVESDAVGVSVLCHLLGVAA